MAFKQQQTSSSLSLFKLTLLCSSQLCRHPSTTVLIPGENTMTILKKVYAILPKTTCNLLTEYGIDMTYTPIDLKFMRVRHYSFPVIYLPVYLF